MHETFDRGRMAARIVPLVSALLVAILWSVQSVFAVTAAQPQRSWLWPTGAPAAVRRAFDPPAQRWLPGHRGVDLAAPVGSSVVAPAAGTVIYAGVLVDRPVISVLLPSGLRLTFEPVEPAVRKGQVVERGDLLGNLIGGHEANSLHWGAKFSDDHYVDPLVFLLGPVRLKPW